MVDLKYKKQQILEAYFPGISSLNDDDADNVYLDASDAQKHKYLAECQKLYVKGRDHLTMNEPLRPERDICDFPDLLSYDIPYWQYQESHDDAILEEMKTPKYIAKAPDKYVSKFYGDWVRLYIDGIFYYGSLYTAMHFILLALEETVTSWIEQRYPYQLQLNTYQCENQKGCVSVEFATNNESNDKQSSRARSVMWDFLKELAPELNDYLNSQTPATYMIYGVDCEGAPTVDLICKNDQTLSLIRPATFMDDFLPKTQNPAYLDLMARRYVKQAIDRLSELGF